MSAASLFARKFSLVATLALAVLLLHSPPLAYAHFPATDREVDAVLHVEPDDNPAPGSPQTLYLILSDVTNRFRLTKCDCSLSISQQNKVLYYAPLTPPPSNQQTVYSTSGMPFTFPAQGNYRIVATGRPLTASAFQSFNLSWNLQVAQPLKSTPDFSASTFLTYFAAILGTFAFIGITLFILS